LFLNPATANVTHPAINSKPPMGVIGPIILNQLQPNTSRQANRYSEPEKNTIPNENK